MADTATLAYFATWLEMINLEQAAINVETNSHLAGTSVRKRMKEENMKLTHIEVLDNDDDPAMAGFKVFLERPYFKDGLKSGEINQGMHVNLHTLNSISFTKGFIAKKHLVIRKNRDDGDLLNNS